MKKAEFKSKIPAKVNLRLVITGKKENMHTLDMIMCPYEKYHDEVEFIPCGAQDTGAGIESVKIKTVLSGFDKDRFLKYYLPRVQYIARELDVYGKLIVHKNIPLGAGLGGSSASLAGAARAMSEFAASIGKTAVLDNDFLLTLGSDVPYMTKGGLCRVLGMGEVVVPLNIEMPDDITVHIAKGGCDSGKCYELYDREFVDTGALFNDFVDIVLQDERNKDEVEMTTKELYACRNDLTQAAFIINPEIKELYEKMQKHFDYVVMSGSGSAVVGFNKKK